MRLSAWQLPAVLACAACGSAAAVRARPPPARAHAAPGTFAVDPSAFSPGACMSLAPTAPPRHLTVFLDAGHGGLDPGAVGTTQGGQTIYEADETLPIELDTATLLRARGFRVVVSRTSDTTVLRLGPRDVSGRLLTARGSHADVAARDVCADDAHASVLVGIYLDAGARHEAGSVTAYDALRPFARDNLRLARLLQRDVLRAMNAQGWGIPDQGVQPDSGLGSALTAQDLAYGHLVLLGPAKRGYFSTPSEMPGALIEPLYITDPFEGSLAVNSYAQQVIAQGLATAIEAYLAPTA